MKRPTMADVAVAAFFLCVVLPRATLPMADGDAWWHIHAGEEVLSSGRVPDTNTWTIAGEGFRWTSQDWLSNVVMATLFNVGPYGLSLLSLTFAVSVVVAFALLWVAIGKRPGSGGPLARILCLTAGLVVAGPIIGIRVQTLDLLMAAATVWALWAWRANPTWQRAALLPLIAGIWVNLHAGWVMLFLLGGATLVGELVDRCLGRQATPRTLRIRDLTTLAVALAVAVVVLVANPNGTVIYAYPFQTASIDAHREFLVEWSPPNLSSFEGQATGTFVVAIVVPTLLLAWRRMPTSDILWLVGITVMALAAVRFALFLGPIGGGIAAVHLAPVLRSLTPSKPVATLLGPFSRPPGSRSLALVNVALVLMVGASGVGLSLMRAAPESQRPHIQRSVPIDAARWIAAERPKARIFNTYSWGGYLARALPEARVYIDGRSDIYGDAVLRQYAAALNASVDPQRLLDDAAIDTVAVKHDAPISNVLEGTSGWRVAHTDATAVVLVRTGDR